MRRTGPGTGPHMVFLTLATLASVIAVTVRSQRCQSVPPLI